MPNFIAEVIDDFDPKIVDEPSNFGDGLDLNVQKEISKITLDQEEEK